LYKYREFTASVSHCNSDVKILENPNLLPKSSLLYENSMVNIVIRKIDSIDVWKSSDRIKSVQKAISCLDRERNWTPKSEKSKR
jgi:hypothetical protein